MATITNFPTINLEPLANATKEVRDLLAKAMRGIALSERDGVTTATLTVLYPSKEERDAALHTGMTEGMTQTAAKMQASSPRTACNPSALAAFLVAICTSSLGDSTSPHWVLSI